ncbi:helix-turn-helix domain-containing protein [Halioglobus sp. HI00S01]|uniref:helix-turn-helix domain-containing protein n=1 Tax=Halioglobus sp. HI00S01 TaxID=1822214 RepID=UPI0018D339B2
MLAGAPNLSAVTYDRVCEALRESERSLRRRLDEEGAKFRDLLRDERRRRCLDYLFQAAHNRASSDTDAARATGFSDRRSFARWFRTEFGLPWTDRAKVMHPRGRRAA